MKKVKSFITFLLVLTLVFSCEEEKKEKHEKHNRFEEVEDKLYSKLHCDKLEITENDGDYQIIISNAEELIDSNNTDQGVASEACMLFMNQLDEFSFDNFQNMEIILNTKGTENKMVYDIQTIMYMSRLENFAMNYISELNSPDSSSLMKYFNPDDFAIEEVTDLVKGYKDVTSQLGSISGFELTGIYFDNPEKPLLSSQVVIKGESNAGTSTLYHEFKFDPKEEDSRIDWINYTIGQMYLGY